MNIGRLICSSAMTLLLPALAIGHGGGLDKDGCHTNRKTGDYHCHQAQSSSSYDYRSTPSPSYSKPYQSPSSTKNSSKEDARIKKNIVTPVKVVSFSDGDTISVVSAGKQERIRLYGIDSPEKSQGYGAKAVSALKKIITGRDIQIKVLDYDRYGRAVALVYADGKSVNDIMIQAGYAWIYPQYCKISVCDDWKSHEAEASVAKRGLWEDKVPTPPWEYRKAAR